MSFWQNLRDQLLNLWNRWTLSQRIGFSAATVACIAAVVGTMVWATQPEYVVIARNREPEQIFEIAGILDTEKIPYEINVSSTAISVPTTQVNDAHFALKDMLHPEEVSQAKSSGFPMFQSPRAEEDQRLRELEARVRQTIKNITGIENASVSISSPEKSPFTEESDPVTAAVLVTMKSGVKLSKQIASNVIRLVAKSVPGLKPEDIVVTDSEGRQFDLQAGFNSQLEENLKIKREIEHELELKAQSVVSRLAGVRSQITVTADIDFLRKSEEIRNFDDKNSGTIKLKSDSEQTKGSPAQPSGIAGVAANATPPANTPSNSSGDRKRTQTETEFVPSERNQKIEDHGGKILSISVAALVDLGDAADPTGGPGSTSAIDETAIEDLIRGAVGKGSEGKDEINIVIGKIAPFEDNLTPTTAPVAFEQWMPIAQYVSLGLAALIAFVMGLMMIKRMKPIVIKETVGPGIPLADARRLASVSEQAKAHPELVASILSAWLNEQETEETAGKTPPPAVPTPETPRGNRGASVPKSATTASGLGTSQERRAA